MTPVGRCPECDTGQLAPCDGLPGYTRCPACNTTFDHYGTGYDTQWRTGRDRS